MEQAIIQRCFLEAASPRIDLVKFADRMPELVRYFAHSAFARRFRENAGRAAQLEQVRTDRPKHSLRLGRSRPLHLMAGIFEFCPALYGGELRQYFLQRVCRLMDDVLDGGMQRRAFGAIVVP